MFFGPFKENRRLKNRVLDIFLLKDPPPHQEKEFSMSAAMRNAAAREDSIRLQTNKTALAGGMESESNGNEDQR